MQTAAGEAGRLEKKLLRLVGRTIGEYGLISHGDRIAVGLSGGKDSFGLLRLLILLKQRAPFPFDVLALTIHSGAAGFESERLSPYLKAEGIAHHVEPTRITKIIREKSDPDSSACAFCARLRRGALYGASQRLGCNKLALGHHLDDTVETLLMNLFFSGCIKAIPPILKADTAPITLIRPLLQVPESMLRDYAALMEFPLIGCGCSLCADKDQQRFRMKRLVELVSDGTTDVRHSARGALANLQPRFLCDTQFHDFSREETPPRTD